MTERGREIYSVIRFGRYMQQSNCAQAKQPIEWIVVREENGKTWLLSRYCLDCYHYHFKDVDVDWAHCDLRAWLREVFLPQAFDPDEQQYLRPIFFSQEDSMGHNNTDVLHYEAYDLVSLMEKDEAMTFFPTYQARRCTTTDYAEAILQKRNVHHPTRVCSWWVRDNHLKHRKAPAIGRLGLSDMYPVTDVITLIMPLICVDDRGQINRE